MIGNLDAPLELFFDAYCPIIYHSQKRICKNLSSFKSLVSKVLLNQCLFLSVTGIIMP